RDHAGEHAGAGIRAEDAARAAARVARAVVARVIARAHDRLRELLRELVDEDVLERERLLVGLLGLGVAVADVRRHQRRMNRRQGGSGERGHGLIWFAIDSIWFWYSMAWLPIAYCCWAVIILAISSPRLTFDPSSAPCWRAAFLAGRIAPLAAVALNTPSPSATSPFAAGASESEVFPSFLPAVETLPSAAL